MHKVPDFDFEFGPARSINKGSATDVQIEIRNGNELHFSCKVKYTLSHTSQRGRRTEWDASKQPKGYIIIREGRDYPDIYGTGGCTLHEGPPPSEFGIALLDLLSEIDDPEYVAACNKICG